MLFPGCPFFMAAMRAVALDSPKIRARVACYSSSVGREAIRFPCSLTLPINIGTWLEILGAPSWKDSSGAIRPSTAGEDPTPGKESLTTTDPVDASTCCEKNSSPLFPMHLAVSSTAALALSGLSVYTFGSWNLTWHTFGTLAAESKIYAGFEGVLLILEFSDKSRS